MSNKFKVGNIIQYNGVSGFNHERGLKQIIFDFDGERYSTRFIDSGEWFNYGEENWFDIDSRYYEECYLVNEDSKYENGVPLIWEDVI
jgi:hypothetical protein